MRDYAGRIWEYCMYQEKSANVSLTQFARAFALHEFSYFDAEYFFQNEVNQFKKTFKEAQEIVQ